MLFVFFSNLSDALLVSVPFFFWTDIVFTYQKNTLDLLSCIASGLDFFYNLKSCLVPCCPGTCPHAGQVTTLPRWRVPSSLLTAKSGSKNHFVVVVLLVVVVVVGVVVVLYTFQPRVFLGCEPLERFN